MRGGFSGQFKVVFPRAVSKGNFLWQVIQNLKALLLSVSVNQSHCISAI